MKGDTLQDRALAILTLLAYAEETGDDFSQALDDLEMSLNEKVDAYGRAIAINKSEQEMIKGEIKRLTARSKALDSHNEWMKNNLSDVMHKLKQEKIKTAFYTASFRKSKSVKVDDIELIPERYLKYPPPEPMKKEIKEAIGNGEDISGAELVETQSLQVR